MSSNPLMSRSAVLSRYHILDTLPEQTYTDIVLLAAHICDTPLALLNFLPDDRQWTKACLGLDIENLALDTSFCIHTLADPHNVLIVPDTHSDQRFRFNPLVTDHPHIRFYAGAPLCTPDGVVIGAVCVLNHVPQTLTAAQSAALQALARQVVSQLELRRTAAALQHSETRFQLFMDTSPFAAFLKDDTGRYQYVNARFLHQFNLDPTAIIGQTDTQIWPSTIARQLQAQDDYVLVTGLMQSTEITLPSAHGHTHIWHVSSFPVPEGAGYWIGGVAVDITAQQQYTQYLEALQQQLQGTVAALTHSSRTDALTGLANRGAFDTELSAAMLQAHETNQPLALILIDVDYFKQYNDSFGHPAGDEVLRQVAAILGSIGRGSDLVARYGGEEFVLLLPNTTADQAGMVAERCRFTIAEAAWPHRSITISCGVAARTGLDLDPVILLAAADTALYQAKQHGRNCVNKEQTA